MAMPAFGQMGCYPSKPMLRYAYMAIVLVRVLKKATEEGVTVKNSVPKRVHEELKNIFAAAGNPANLDPELEPEPLDFGPKVLHFIGYLTYFNSVGAEFLPASLRPVRCYLEPRYTDFATKWFREMNGFVYRLNSGRRLTNNDRRRCRELLHFCKALRLYEETTQG